MFVADTVYTVTISDTVRRVKAFLPFFQRKPSIAVDNRMNMRIIENKNKNYSFNTDAVERIEISKQADAQ
ncbi:hypothetical protein CE91St46_31660 [Eubacteriales bacterium]|nr:hypothetical protein CE91St46_31660 [Eubacteriales bacterium]GKH64775.1 hypothetical protein CE91St47_32440 [Eubacteriales bacterium]